MQMSRARSRLSTPMINAETAENILKNTVFRNWKNIQRHCRNQDQQNTGTIKVEQLRGIYFLLVFFFFKIKICYYFIQPNFKQNILAITIVLTLIYMVTVYLSMKKPLLFIVTFVFVQFFSFLNFVFRLFQIN